MFIKIFNVFFHKNYSTISINKVQIFIRVSYDILQEYNDFKNNGQCSEPEVWRSSSCRFRDRLRKRVRAEKREVNTKGTERIRKTEESEKRKEKKNLSKELKGLD